MIASRIPRSLFRRIVIGKKKRAATLIAALYILNSHGFPLSTGHFEPRDDLLAVAIDYDRVSIAKLAAQYPGGDRVFNHSLNGATQRAGAIERVEAGQVTVGKRHFDYYVDDPRQWNRSGDSAGGKGRASIVAPMPGKVVRILVAAGDEVAAGQGIVVIEAMKMQNEMKAPRAGRVAAIQARENDSVVAGAVLAVIDPTPVG